MNLDIILRPEKLKRQRKTILPYPGFEFIISMLAVGNEHEHWVGLFIFC
jgi:hypothetical protein